MGPSRTPGRLNGWPRAAQQRVDPSEDRVAAVLSALEDAIIELDEQGRIRWLNRAGEELTRRSSEQARGTPLESLLPSILISGGEAIQPLLEQDREELATWQVVIKRGSESARHMRARLLSVPVPGGGRAQKLLLLRDVTEQEHALRKLEFADRLVSLGQLAAGMTHEINNPLTALFAQASMLKQTLCQAQAEGQLAARISLREMVERVSEMEDSLKHIAEVVAGVGDFSKPRAPGMLCADLNRVVRWAVRASASEMQNRGRVIVSLGELPLVRLDETRLGQVLLNMLLNAAKALDHEKSSSNWVRISAFERRSSVVILVSDTGGGISAEAATRIFEPFFTTRADGGGTGLGLSVSATIVESVGGTIEVESELGLGSTFRIMLPVASETRH